MCGAGAAAQRGPARGQRVPAGPQGGGQDTGAHGGGTHSLLLILGLSSVYLPVSCISLVVSSMGTQAPLRIMSVKY